VAPAVGLVVPVLGVLLVWMSQLPSVPQRRLGANARRRIPAANLAAQDGCSSKPSLIMLLGTDGDKTAARRSLPDSILLVRTDPKRHRMSYLRSRAIPGRHPGRAEQDQRRVPTRRPCADDEDRAALTACSQPRRPRRFRQLQGGDDALGGEIDASKPTSNRFDCLYATARCQQWPGWRFEKGKQTMAASGP
jgi:hypothetical protein